MSAEKLNIALISKPSIMPMAGQMFRNFAASVDQAKTNNPTDNLCILNDFAFNKQI